jgi:hypothetical protein
VLFSSRVGCNRMFPRNGRPLGHYFAFVLSPLSSLLLLFMVMVLALGVQIYAVNNTTSIINNTTNTHTKSAFQVGYNHGCSDVKISNFTDRYINQPGKGPNFHTDEFMRGYDTGYNTCS